MFITVFVSIQSLRATERNIQISQEKNEAERFSKATELLSDKALYARLGGMYTLAQLAKTNEYFEPALDVLVAYLADLSPYVQEEVDAKLLALETYLQHLLEEEGITQPELLKAGAMAKCKSDFKCKGEAKQVFNLIGRILSGLFWVEQIEKNYLGILQINKVYLWGIESIGAAFPRVRFDGVSFVSAMFAICDFRGASFIGGDWRFADFRNSNFSQVRCLSCRLDYADFSGCLFYGADLSGTKGLKTEQLEKSFGSRDTKLPKGLERPKGWDRNPPDYSQMALSFLEYTMLLSPKLGVVKDGEVPPEIVNGLF